MRIFLFPLVAAARPASGEDRYPSKQGILGQPRFEGAVQAVINPIAIR